MESWNFFSGEASSSSPTALGLSELFSGTTLVSPGTSSLSLDSGSRVSGPLVEPKSSLIALKLGSQSHGGNDTRCLLRETTTTSSSSSPPMKRARGVRGGVCSQTTPFCQALGCNMDLSGSKDYHKKHKVCDFHSKSPKVIVDGIEQRFCQQCSRFHLLGEFDESKRSCRRRLAGHNERRRKPQFDAHSDKPFRFSRSYQGDKFFGTSLQNRTPFVFSDILPGVVVSPENYEQVNNPFGQFKFEEKPAYGDHHYLASSKSFFPRSESEDYYFNPPATLHRSLEAASNTSRALSLLSAQSQNFSSHSAMARHCFPSNGFYSSGTDLMEPATMIPEANHRVAAAAAAADFEVISDGDFFQGTSYLQPKYCLGATAAAPENGSTVDLIQLSSHLQRVEHQRSFMQVKQENDEFCCFQTA